MVTRDTCWQPDELVALRLLYPTVPLAQAIVLFHRWVADGMRQLDCYRYAVDRSD